MAEEEALDPRGALQEDGRGVLDGLELVVALLEVGLVAVGAQQLGVDELLVVGDEREAAVGGGVVDDLVGIDGELEPEAKLRLLAVARVLSGAPAALLAVSTQKEDENDTQCTRTSALRFGRAPW